MTECRTHSSWAISLAVGKQRDVPETGRAGNAEAADSSAANYNMLYFYCLMEHGLAACTKTRHALSNPTPPNSIATLE